MSSLIERVDIESNGSRMVNNAGVGLNARRHALCHLTEQDVWDMTMNVNEKSVFLG